MIPFHVVDREIAERETRTIHVLNAADLPKDSYSFVELYCIEPGCDCRRVMFNVYRESIQQQVATINHSFEPGGKFDFAQTFLDPLNPQSTWSPAILDLCKKSLLSDRAYVQRLHRHYALVKAAVADPDHPVQQYVHELEAPRRPILRPIVREGAKIGRNDPCPCGSGKKYKKCCADKEVGKSP